LLVYLQVQKYFSTLPTSKVPKLGTPGERFRDRQLVLQLPKQDLALAYCKHIDRSQHASYEDFITARNEIALDIGYIKVNASNAVVIANVFFSHNHNYTLFYSECAHNFAVFANTISLDIKWSFVLALFTQDWYFNVVVFSIESHFDNLLLHNAFILEGELEKISYPKHKIFCKELIICL
jgi:hypothetical protein